MPFTEFSFEEIAESYQPLIKKMVKHYMAGMTYDEAYQMGLIALWEACMSYDPERGHFPAYAKFHLTRTFLTHIRSRQRDKERFVWDEGLIAAAPALAQFEEDFLAAAEVDRCRPCLTPREYSWLYLTVIKGLATSEIAANLEVSPHTVRSWKKSAVMKLRKKLLRE
jgi:DNA-directed RNA polymerase